MIELEWEYSRNQGMHTLSDGNYFETDEDHGNTTQLWHIKACTDTYNYRTEGYDLWHKGKNILHGITVKVLKEYVKVSEKENGQYTIF